MALRTMESEVRMDFPFEKERFSETSPHQWFAQTGRVSGEDIVALITDVFDWLEDVWHLPVADKEHRRIELPLPFTELHEEGILLPISNFCVVGLKLSVSRYGSIMWFLLNRLYL